MTSRSCIYSVAVLATAFATLTAAVQQPSGPVVFRRINVVDVVSGSIVPTRDVVVRGDRIQSIEPAGTTPIPTDARVINGSGKFLIPGLWDAHVHTRYDGIDHLGLLLTHGVTQVRDLGGGWEHLGRIRRWNDQIAARKLLGPRIIAAGVLLDGPTSTWSHAEKISTPDEGRRAVARLKAEGAGYVKVYTRLGEASLAAIIDEAARQELAVGGHVVQSVGVRTAISMGQTAVEHTGDLLIAVSEHEERFVSEQRAGRPVLMKEVVATFSAPKAIALAEHFRRNNVRLVPTLALYDTQLRIAKGAPEVHTSPALRYVPAAYVHQWKEAPKPPVEGRQAVLSGASQLVRLMSETGVEIIAGTDVVKPFFVPGSSLHDELEHLVKIGLPTAAALRAATHNPAHYLGLRDLGTIEPRKHANLVVLNADPIKDITNVRAINGVMVDGVYLDRTSLDEKLRRIAQAAAEWTGTPTGQ